MGSDRGAAASNTTTTAGLVWTCVHFLVLMEDHPPLAASISDQKP